MKDTQRLNPSDISKRYGFKSMNEVSREYKTSDLDRQIRYFVTERLSNSTTVVLINLIIFFNS